MRGPFSALKFRSTRHIATRHGHTQKKEGRNVCVIPLPPTKDSGNKRQFSKMVISAGLKQEQRAPSSYLKAINAPYRPYYISLTFSPFIYIARDFFFVLFCYCFLLSCVKARAALNFFFSFYFGPAGRPRANISLKRGFLRCCWANSNRPFRLAESMDERRRKKKITDPGRQLLFLPRPVVNAAEDKRKEENGRRSTTSRTQKTGKVVKNVTVAQWIVVFHKNGPNCPLYALFRRPFHCITDSLSLPPVSSFRSFMPVIRLWTAPKLFSLLLFSLKMYTSRNTL